MKEHIKVIDLLRGLAALGVVLFHFGAGATLPLTHDNFLSSYLTYGKYGVQVFFVISGFVIPYSMYKEGIDIKQYPRNLLKRYVRIAPPAFISILLLCGFYYSAIIVLNRPINGTGYWPGINFRSLLGNFTFIAPYINTAWFNIVFWTLTIEFQFYILVPWILYLLVKGRVNFFIAVVCTIILLFYLPGFSFFNYGVFFVIGMLLFAARENILIKNNIYLLLLVSFAACYFQDGIVGFLIATLTAISIRYLKYSNVVTTHLGKISYSLYLTHLVVGFSAEIIFKRITSIYQSEAGKILLILIYTCLAIIFATGFYYFVERYFIKLSKSLTRRRDS